MKSINKLHFSLTMFSILMNISSSSIIRSSDSSVSIYPSFDNRNVLSRSEAKYVYDYFATVGHAAGKDASASSGYGGPAVKVLVKMADFNNAKTILDYGSGQGKLAEFVLENMIKNVNINKCGKIEQEKKLDDKVIHWKGVDQSPKMIEKFRDRCVNQFGEKYCSTVFLENGDPSELVLEDASIDRFISTYCLDLMSEEDMYKVLDKAEKCLDPDNGLLLLIGITWGYKQSIKTFLMTTAWELMYKFGRKKVGGCRPQNLMPYLKARGWRIKEVEYTLPNGYPWMVSEVISARPPLH